ncbi:hypothetical protein D1007_56408 [Hordeum vulgare]|nr:hypothetical protein D1007_56408 [Hordeum vulgare]
MRLHRREAHPLHQLLHTNRGARTTRNRGRLTLAPQPTACAPAPLPVTRSSTGSRFSCLGSDSEEEEAPAVGVQLALEVLGIDDGGEEGNTMSHRKKKTDAEIVQQFWIDAGFPTPASRFWERRSPSPAGEHLDLEGSSVVNCIAQERLAEADESEMAIELLDHKGASSPSRIRLGRPPKMGSWRGPLPPRRVTPPPILGQFIDVARQCPSSASRGGSPTRITSPGSGADRAPVSVATSQEFQNTLTSCTGPMHAEWDTGQELFSWACLRTRMRALWSGFPTRIAENSSSSTPPAAKEPTAAPESLAFARTPLPAPSPTRCHGIARSYAAVAAEPHRPMAGVPPTTTRLPGDVQWKREAIQHGSDAYLVSFPSLEDLDRVDGIQMNVPSVNAQMTVTAWRSQEVPHKIELQQIWLHVDGVPHTVRHFLGLWAVGTLMGKTLDVDLISLRRRGVVRILVAMTNTQILAKDKDDAGPFVATDVVVKLKGYAFTFRREPRGYTPDPEFVPFIWRRKSDDADDDSGAKEKDDEMDTSEHTGNPSINSSSSSVPAKIIQVPHVQRREVASLDLGGVVNTFRTACRVSVAVVATISYGSVASPVSQLRGSTGHTDLSSKHRQPTCQVALQPSSTTVTTAWASSNQPTTAVEMPAQDLTRDEVSTPEGSTVGVPACMHAPMAALHPQVTPDVLAQDLTRDEVSTPECSTVGVHACMHAPMAALHPQVMPDVLAIAVQTSDVPITPTVESTTLDAYQPHVQLATTPVSDGINCPLHDTPEITVSTLQTVEEGVATTLSSPPPTVKLARPSSTKLTPTRRSGRHTIADDGTMDTDEDSLARDMRRKAAHNLDNEVWERMRRIFLFRQTL